MNRKTCKAKVPLRTQLYQSSETEYSISSLNKWSCCGPSLLTALIKQEVVRPLSIDERTLILATAVSIDFDYFSQHSHGSGLLPFGFMPFPGAPVPYPSDEGGAGADVEGGDSSQPEAGNSLLTLSNAATRAIKEMLRSLRGPWSNQSVFHRKDYKIQRDTDHIVSKKRTDVEPGHIQCCLIAWSWWFVA